MSLTTTPSCCAGLQPTLLRGWQQGFPLHSSPFRQMADQCGATPLELLRKCVQLQDSGALAPIRPRWGKALQCERWRLGFDAGQQATSWSEALSRLPGCVRIEHVEGQGTWLWAEIEARDEVQLQQQLARLPAPPDAQLCMPSAGVSKLDAGNDLTLAAHLEGGLELCINPFSRCAKVLKRTERQILSTLYAWRHSGLLEALTLAPPPAQQPQSGVLAHWREVDLSTISMARLQALSGLDRLVVASVNTHWPWRLSILMLGMSALAEQQLTQRLRSIGLHQPPDVCDRVKVELPRNAALLFTA